MSTTKKEAMKTKIKFEKKYPNLKCIIIDQTKIFPKGDGLRYNFRFEKR